MGILKNKYGVYYVRKKVPKRLEQAVAQLLGNGKPRQAFLKKSLDTKNLQDAKRRAPAVLMQFSATLAQAHALLVERPLRTTVSKREIDLIADYHFAETLAEDERETREGMSNRTLLRSIHDQLRAADVEFSMPIPFPESYPKFGLAEEETVRRAVDLEFDLETAQAALARGDISRVSEHLDYLLNGVFRINLDTECEAYREVGLGVLRAHVKALQAIAQRMKGEPVDTPVLPAVASEPAATGEALSAAFAGWKKARNPSPGAVAEYERAVKLFAELHGDMPIVKIRRSHARHFMEALQDVPRRRTGELLNWSLPQLAEWGRAHPELTKVTAATVNKQVGGVQAVTRWGAHHGMVPDEVPWADPFAGVRLEEDDSNRAPFTVPELQKFFGSRVFTEGDRPQGGRGETAYWLPLLGLYTGGRLNELASLMASSVLPVATTGQYLFDFAKDKARGRRLKTKSSARAVPVHPELERLGFLQHVERVRSEHGADAWLFPLVSPESKSGAASWSKWFGRYLTSIRLTDPNKVFHSFRHSFTDALRAGVKDRELRMALLGHADASVHGEYGAKEMIARWGIDVLVAAIRSVKYPGLHIPTHGEA